MRTKSPKTTRYVVMFTLTLAIMLVMMTVETSQTAHGQVPYLPTLVNNAMCQPIDPPEQIDCQVCNENLDWGCQYEMPSGFVTGVCVNCSGCYGKACQYDGTFDCGFVVNCRTYQNGAAFCNSYDSINFCQ